MYAVHGSVDCLSALLAAHADVNAVDDTGMTALMLSVGFLGNVDCFKALIAAHADVNLKDNQGESAIDQLEQEQRHGVKDADYSEFEMALKKAGATNWQPLAARRHSSPPATRTRTILLLPISCRVKRPQTSAIERWLRA